jgi:hypothetical protein
MTLRKSIRSGRVELKLWNVKVSRMAEILLTSEGGTAASRSLLYSGVIVEYRTERTDGK